MDTERYERLVGIMAAMAAGDPAAVFCLSAEFGGHVGAAMRRETRRAAHLAERHAGCALVLDALEHVATRRDRAIVLEVRVQMASAGHSPALTVARRHGLTPEVVRQVVGRVRARLNHLAARDDRFAPLADVPLRRMRADPSLIGRSAQMIRSVGSSLLKLAPTTRRYMRKEHDSVPWEDRMDSKDVLAADLGGVASGPRARHRYGDTCARCGGAIMVQQAGRGADLLVLDYDETWVHAACL